MSNFQNQIIESANESTRAIDDAIKLIKEGDNMGAIRLLCFVQDGNDRIVRLVENEKSNKQG